MSEPTDSENLLVVAEVLEVMCDGCGLEIAEELHECPYGEINPNVLDCNCCEKCQRACAMEI